MFFLFGWNKGSITLYDDLMQILPAEGRMASLEVSSAFFTHGRGGCRKSVTSGYRVHRSTLVQAHVSNSPALTGIHLRRPTNAHVQLGPNT